MNFACFPRRGRSVLALLCLLLTLALTPRPASAQGVPLGLNIDVNEQAYVDLIQPNGTFSAISGTLAADPNGWPSGDFQYFVDNRYTFAWFSGAPNVDPLQKSTDISGTYKLSFTGQATLGGWGYTSIANQIYNTATNTTTADVTIPNPAGGVVFSLQFTNTRRLPGDASATGVTNVHLIRPGYTPGTSQVFTNLWLGAITNYHWNALRFMGALGTNSYGQSGSNEAYPYLLQWPADRAIPGYGPLYASHAGVHGLPWEDVAAIGAATGRDLWINVPVNASDNYVTQLATLLKNGLPSTTNIYVEYSNEMWHLGFPQGPWNKQAAQDEVAAGTSNLNYDGVGNPDIWRMRRIAKRTIEMGNIFKTVFADNGTRIRPVINNAFTGFDADILTYVTRNYGSPRQFLYGIAQTGYYVSADKSSVPAILAGEMANSDSNAAGYVQSRAIATFYGLHSLVYEGGQGETGNQTPGPPYWGTTDTTLPNLFAAARDAGMQGVETHDLLGNWFPSGGDLYMQFSEVGRYSTYGMWGLSDDLTNQTSGKWQGMIQTMAAPVPAVTAGLALPSAPGGTASTPEVAPPNTNFTLPSDQPWLEQLLRASLAGTYTLTLTGRQTDTSGPLQVWVDNTLVGTTSLPSAIDGLSSPAVAFTLTPGLHSLFVYGPPSSGSSGIATQSGDALSITLTTVIPTAAPTFNPPGGTYTGPQTVRLSDATPGAALYYTTDGSQPTPSSTPYTGPITVGGSGETLRAVALAPGYGLSQTSTATYYLTSPGTALSVANVTGAVGQTVTLTATLTSGGAGVSGKTLSFQVDNNTPLTGVTNPSGVASVAYLIPANATPGSHTISVTFAGDSGDQASSGTATLTVTAAPAGQVRFWPRTGYTQRMVGGQFQASHDNANWTTLATVTQNPPAGQYTTLPTTQDPAPFRFLRYLAPNGSYGDVAEIEFDSNGQKLTGTGFGTPGSYHNDGTTFLNALDGNPATFFDGTTPSGDFVGIDQGGTAPTYTKLTGTVFGTAGSYHNDGTTIANAFDGSLATFFDGPGPNGDYAGLDLGSGHGSVVTRLQYCPRSGFGSRMVGGVFQGSNDNATWTALFTVTSAPAVGVLTQTTSIGSGVSYRYLRYLAPNNSYGDVAEIEFDTSP